MRFVLLALCVLMTSEGARAEEVMDSPSGTVRIVGAGCRPHPCNRDSVALAISRKDGTAVIAMKQDGRKAQL